MITVNRCSTLVEQYDNYCHMFKACSKCPYQNMIHCRMAFAYDQGVADEKGRVRKEQNID